MIVIISLTVDGPPSHESFADEQNKHRPNPPTIPLMEDHIIALRHVKHIFTHDTYQGANEAAAT